MTEYTFSPWPSYSQEEIDAVSNVLKSNKVNYWTGRECVSFEKEFASWCSTDYAIALANGTVALDLALQGLGIGPGDEVIVTPRTFIASVSSIVNAGATPVFADVDYESQNITPESIQAVITKQTRAIICVHLGGWPCDMEPIMKLADKFNLFVIEDCAQAHGALYQGKPLGSIGHIGAWSFCQDKIMSTGGEGGMITTNDKALWSRIWGYKDHGKSLDAINAARSTAGFSWVHESFGGNGRMTEMQAAIGRIQLKRMKDWHSQRSRNANQFIDALSGCKGLRAPRPADDVEHAWYKLTVFIEPEYLRDDWDRDRVMSEICASGVPCRVGPCSEVYLEKAFDNTGFRPSTRLENAKLLGETSLMFPVHPTLDEMQVKIMSDVVVKIILDAEK